MRPQFFHLLLFLLVIAVPLAVLAQPPCYSTSNFIQGRTQCQNPPYRSTVWYHLSDMCQYTFCQPMTLNNVSGLESYSLSVRNLDAIPKPTNYVQVNRYNDSSCTFLTYIDYLSQGMPCVRESYFEATCVSKTSAHMKFFSHSCSTVWFDKTSPFGQCNEGPMPGEYHMIIGCTDAPGEASNSPTTSDASPQTFYTITLAATLVLLCLVRFF